MAMSIVKMAKTIEEAISLGLKDLDVEREQVIVEVLEEPTKRFFGLLGSTQAKVRLEKRIEIETETVKSPEVIAEEFLKSVFEKMDIDCGLKIETKKSDLLINIIDIDSKDKGIIIGKRGNTLDSLQYLTSLVVNKESEKFVRVSLDVGNYREKREDTLRSLAKKMAEKAKSTKKPVRLEPMSAYERRIIHSALQKQSDINTFSEGKEPFRRIVIESKPKNP